MKSIRIADENDAEHIASLGKITFEQTFGHLFEDKQDLVQYLDKTFSVAKIESSLQKVNNVYWIATYDNEPVGYAKLKLNSTSPFLKSESTSQLQKIYVLKDFISKKIGKELTNALLTKAKEKGSNEIWLSVLNENFKAIQFYKKGDFKVVGEHDFQIGKESFDFVVMSKSL